MVQAAHDFRKIFPLFKQRCGYLQFFAAFFSIDGLGAADPADLAEAALKAGKNGGSKCRTAGEFGPVSDHAPLNGFDGRLGRGQSARGNHDERLSRQWKSLVPQGPQPFQKDRHKPIGIVKIGGRAENDCVGRHQLRI